jgi:Fe(3+) dicitrate transport protein
VAYDVGAYEVRVDNRFGTLVRADAATGEPYVYKTNVGATRTRGLELRVDAPLATLAGPGGGVAVRGFTAAALTDAAYRGGTVVDGGAGGANRALRGNRVEGVPASIVRSGLTAAGGGAGLPRWSATLLASRTAASYADPHNTAAPTANGARGRVPAYTLVDLDGAVEVAPWLRVGAGVSNALDARYFTKRPTFYPGPGVWPSDGRAVRVSLDLIP